MPAQAKKSGCHFTGCIPFAENCFIETLEISSSRTWQGGCNFSWSNEGEMRVNMNLTRRLIGAFSCRTALRLNGQANLIAALLGFIWEAMIYMGMMLSGLLRSCFEMCIPSGEIVQIAAVRAIWRQFRYTFRPENAGH